MDFDETCFDTFRPVVGGIDVEAAYAIALREVLGEKGLEIFISQGLNNRAPAQIIDDILAEDPSLLTGALQLAMAELDHLVPQGLGVSECEIDPHKRIVERMVRVKLRYLLRQVGRYPPRGDIWPAPCKGFCEFWLEVQQQKERTNLVTAILSSGHHVFIQKVFEIYGLTVPDVIVSDDTIRALPAKACWKHCSKPSAVPYQLAQAELARRGFGRQEAAQSLFIGDDLAKDGGLAEAAGISFFHFTSGPSTAQFVFSNWGVLTDSMREGSILNLIKGR